MLYFDNLKAINMDLFPTYPGTLTIDWLSIVLLVIVGLFAIGGIARGAAKTFLNNFGGIINLVLSIVVATLLCNMLAQMDFASSIRNPIHDWFLGLGGEEVRAVMNESHSRDDVLLLLTNNGYEIIAKVIPSFLNFLYPFITAFLASCVPEVPTEASVADNIASGITALIFAIVIFVIMEIILSIILGAISKAVRKRHKVKKPGFFSRFFGFFIGGAVGVIMSIIVVWIFSFLGGVQFFKDFLTNVWALDNDEVLTIGEYLYKTNYVNMFISWIGSLL